MQRMGEFEIKVALVQINFHKPARRLSVAPYTQRKEDTFTLTQRHLHDEGWMCISFISLNAHGERRDTISAHNFQTDVLLPTRDNCTQVILGERYLTGGACIVWADLKCQSDGKFTMGAFHNAHQAMTRTIFACPRIIVHPPVRPGTQSLDRHEIRQYHFTFSTSKSGLEHITPMQVAL